jgi:hypothetical protein
MSAAEVAVASPSGVVQTVLESIDLFSLVCDYLPTQNLFVISAVCREWHEILRGEPIAAAIPSDDPSHQALDHSRLLTRFLLPDARKPDRREWLEGSGARAPVAAETARERREHEERDAAAAAAAEAATADSSAGHQVVEENCDDPAAAASLQYLHHRSLLSLSQCPSSLAGQRALLQLFRHPRSELKQIRLSGAAESMVGLLADGNQLDDRTLRRLEVVDACDCLVGQVLPRGDSTPQENPLIRTLRRWSATPLHHSPEHAAQHTLDLTILAILAPKLTAIRELNLAHQHLWDSALEIVGRHCHRTLTAINLNFNVDLTNSGLQYLDQCFLLRELQLQRLWKLNGEGITQFVNAIATGWTKLKADEPAMQSLQVADIIVGASPSPTCDLRFLNLNELRQRGEAVLLAFAACSPHLRHLELAETNLTQSGVERLLTMCKEVEFINLGKIGTGVPNSTPTPTAAAAAGGSSASVRHPLLFPPSAATPSAAASLPSHIGALPPTTAANVIDFGLPRRRSAIMQPSTAAPSTSTLPVPGAAPFVPDFVARQFMDQPLTDSSIALLHEVWCGLRRIDLERSAVTERGLAMMSKHDLPHLEYLALWQCPHIGDAAVETLLGKDVLRGREASENTTLQFLLLPHNPSILTHRSTTLLATHARALRHLVGYVLCTFTETLDQLRGGWKQLRSLSLCVEAVRTPFGQKAAGTKLTSVGLRTLVDFAHLECLDISHVSTWRDADFRFVLQRLRWLRVLKVTKCGLTDEAFRWSNMDAGERGTIGGSAARATVPSSSSAASSCCSANAVPAAAPAPLYFDSSTVGWECRLELIYLSQLAHITSRTLSSLGSLSSLRYLDITGCPALREEAERVEGIRRGWREQVESGRRLPLMCTVQY